MLQVLGSSEGDSEVETGRPVNAVGACKRANADCACHLVCCVVGVELVLWSGGDCSCVQCRAQHCHGNRHMTGQWNKLARVTLTKVS